ncbi:hypothetical protein LJB78_00955 [Bacteroidales bacterium OttesenSCG-928-J16]|nr:hypothetical protein [Bacteroidales bacterium OttesenSCG-928-J16]
MKMTKNTKLIILLILPLSICCNDIGRKKAGNNLEEETKSDSLYELPVFVKDSFIDARDNRVYHTIEIGTQIWCVEDIEYITQKTKSWDYDGRLYNWKAAVEACPETCSIPSDEDWNILINYIEEELIKKSSSELFENLKCNIWRKSHSICHGSCQKPENIAEYEELMEDEQIIILSIYLENIGFSCRNTGFKHSYFGHDGFTYFWSSTVDRTNDHKWKRFKDFKCGIPRPDFMVNSDKFGLRLRCIKNKK